NIEALINKGMEEKRRIGKLFDTPLPGMTARNTMGFATSISDGTIDHLDRTSTVIIGKDRYDLSKPENVSRLKAAATSNYNSFIGGHLVNTAQLAAAEAAERT